MFNRNGSVHAPIPIEHQQSERTRANPKGERARAIFAGMAAHSMVLRFVKLYSATFLNL
jgi:hypothetical protein